MSPMGMVSIASFTTQSPIGYTNGLVIAIMLLVILWCLIRIDRVRAQKAQDKAISALNKIEL